MNPRLYKAATQGDVEMLRRLVEDPEDPSILRSTTPQLNTALHLAALHGHAAFAGEVLGKNVDALVARNDDGDTPLHLASKAGRLEAAKLLIRHALAWPEDKKSPLIMTNKAGNTALHEAVRSRRAAVAVALLDADPVRGHDLNERMESPLHMAAREGLVQVVRKIVDYTLVDPELLPPLSVTVSGTALHQAVLGTHYGIMEILLEKRPELIELTDSDGNNALRYAAHKDHRRAAEMPSTRCRKQHLPSLQGRRRGLNNSDFDKVVESYFLAATLIATVTFAATFTMPGGYDQTKGVACHGHSKAFKIFVVSNTVAMRTSMVVIFLLIWARQEPVTFRLRNLAWSQQLTVIACLAMLLSLITAVYVTAAPIAPWPAYAVIAIAIGSPALFFYVYWTGTTWA
ncbi:hypothetical protein HU200_048732 [Digitaria exilis]|uniref:PGG domain-containing protein n=1 Tax=Digitaria exilis TaxID=1010633 RepID=A0A835B5C3_9POAL|nr:hypothetical protein HU200_048732 [Digitaria exilis]